MRTLTIVFILLLLSFITLPSDALAQKDFTTDYDVTYTVGENANTNAKLAITLTNTSPTFYASTYTLHVGFNNIQNVVASDGSGKIEPKIQKNEEGNTISLILNQKSVGKGKKTNITLTFDTPDIAKKQGNIWEVNIPGIANLEDFSNFSVRVITDESLGQPTYIKPQRNGQDMVFTKEELGRSGISLAFGENQVYGFDLKYNLKNTNFFPIVTDVAIPPSTNYQEIYIDDISPRPLDVVVDHDGNWLAKYELKASEELVVTVKGKTEIQLHPKKEPLSEENQSKYLMANTYWEKDSRKIKDLASRLKKPEAIYQYIIENLRYDFTRVNTDQTRLGALQALEKKNQAVCLEFTDLFIAIARAAGIPARELNGFALTENSKQRPLSLQHDILHSWPEYYDKEKGTWIMVDPTWGATTGGIDYFHTFDFDHFVFVRKGIDSKYPIPAGGYKSENDIGKKDVHISFANEPGESKEDFNITSNAQGIYSSFFPSSGEITIQNTGRQLVTNQRVTIISDALEPREQTISITNLPPYGKTSERVTFAKLPFLTNNTYNFTIKTQDTNVSQNVIISPFVLEKKYIFGGISIVISIIILIFTIKAWRLPFLR